MPTDNVDVISSLVKYHFPEFYREQGSEFVLFMEAYYEWLETDAEILSESKKLFDTTDIDRTQEKFLLHFRTKYMDSLPMEIIGNQRLFQKHILELYRSKGSIAGLKLLFRLLYNEDVDVYIPSYDIFKTSDGIWKVPKYIEVSDSPAFYQYSGRVITGGISKAKATVESVEKKIVDARPIYVIYLSNIQGHFRVGEQLLYDGIIPINASFIVGSPTEFTLNTSGANFEVGDVLVDQELERIKPVKVVVSEVYDSVGIIEFNLVKRGTWYTTDAVLEVTQGANTTGIGAAARVGSIRNAVPYTYSPDMVRDYVNTQIDASTYGFPGNTSANSSTTISDAIRIFTVLAGEIDTIITTNPGTGYDGDVTVRVYDPITYSRGIPDGEGGWGGNNAVVTGKSITGFGLISKVKVYDSGHGYYFDDEVIGFQKVDDDAQLASFRVQIDGVGQGEGYYDDSKGFLSDDKYLHDGHYYQNFSYVVKSTKALENYLEILRKTVHIAGNAVFSIVRFREETFADFVEESVLISTYGWSPLWMFTYSGLDGAWYDPSDPDTLWQNTAGTIPITGNNQPVALMKDKSGNGRHLYQANNDLRPMFRREGANTYYLFCDGTYLTSNNNYTLPATHFVSAAISRPSESGTILFGPTGGTPASRHAILGSGSGNTMSGQLLHGANTFTATTIIGTANTDLKQVMSTLTYPGLTDIMINKDNQIFANNNFANNTTAANTIIYVNNQVAQMNFYGGMIIQTDPGLTQRAYIDRYMGYQAGLTI